MQNVSHSDKHDRMQMVLVVLCIHPCLSPTGATAPANKKQSVEELCEQERTSRRSPVTFFTCCVACSFRQVLVRALTCSVKAFLKVWSVEKHTGLKKISIILRPIFVWKSCWTIIMSLSSGHVIKKAFLQPQVMLKTATDTKPDSVFCPETNFRGHTNCCIGVHNKKSFYH